MSKPDYEKEIIIEFEHKLESMLDDLDKCKSRKVEYFDKLNTLLKIYKYLKYFNRLDKYLEPKILELEREDKFKQLRENSIKEREDNIKEK